MNSVGLKARCRIGILRSISKAVKIPRPRLNIVDHSLVISPGILGHGNQSLMRAANVHGNFFVGGRPNYKLTPSVLPKVSPQGFPPIFVSRTQQSFAFIGLLRLGEVSTGLIFEWSHYDTKSLPIQRISKFPSLVMMRSQRCMVAVFPTGLTVPRMGFYNLVCNRLESCTSGVSGNNSVVECDLAKVEVVGSNPISRSINFVVSAGGE